MTGAIRTAAIYEALFDDEALGALPDLLCQAAGARSATLQWRHRDAAHEVMAWNHFPRAFIELYVSSYSAVDPWVKAAVNAGRPGEFLPLHRYVPAAVFENSRLWREFIEPSGDDTFHCAAAAIPSLWGEGIMGVARGRGERPFEEADLAPLNKAAPHLRRLLQVRGELAGARRGSRVTRDALDGLEMCAIVASADGRALQINLGADAVLRRADGLRLAGERLNCLDAGDAAALEAALRAATDPHAPSAAMVTISRAEGRLAYMASVTPLAGGGRPLALVVLRDPSADDDALELRLRDLYGLGRTDAAIAIDVSRGRDVAAIASLRGLSPAAVRARQEVIGGRMDCPGRGRRRAVEIAARVSGLPDGLDWLVAPSAFEGAQQRPQLTLVPSPALDG